jgi:putative DNA primase/helicase
MRHCRDDAAALPEPEWYRMLTVVARCEGAERWAHQMSRPYPKYSKRATTHKLKQASGKSVAPVTCNYVRTALNGEQLCTACQFGGKVNSPIAIGRTKDAYPINSAPPAGRGDTARPSANSLSAVSQDERFTDLGNARRFVARYRGKAAYCAPFGKWYLWDGKRWRDDEKLEVIARAGDLIRSLYPLAQQIKDERKRKAFVSHLHNSESHRALSAMVSLAKSDSSIARLPDDFDADPWVLTVENGTIDLRTGKLLPHDPKNLITKLAPVQFDASAKCPNWDEFLDLIMDGRAQLTGFLKRAFGTSLTGVTSDKALFIFYGPAGDNGKSTVIDVMQRLLGDYARRTPVDTFLTKREGAIPNDIARLKGARLVWSSENERGSRLSEALIKDLTGGDRIAARFMRAEFFEFMPEFKLLLATNHKPAVRGDAAIWRRLKLVPFDVSIPKDRQKPRHEVMAMFQAELPGILNWAIEGCLEWQRDGLGVPEEIAAATQEYEAEQDTFAMFLDERCVRTPNARASSLELYQAYRAWSEQRGESAVTHKTFASLMSERSFAKSKTKTGAIYFGIGLVGVAHFDLPRPQATTWQHQSIPEEEKWVA